MGFGLFWWVAGCFFVFFWHFPGPLWWSSGCVGDFLAFRRLSGGLGGFLAVLIVFWPFGGCSGCFSDLLPLWGPVLAILVIFDRFVPLPSPEQGKIDVYIVTIRLPGGTRLYTALRIDFEFYPVPQGLRVAFLLDLDEQNVMYKKER